MKHLLFAPLDAIFSAPSHIAILRALLDSREGMSGRAAARMAGINHQACAVALRRLEEAGVISRMGSGKTQLVRLRFQRVLVKEALVPLLQAERRIMSGLRSAISDRFRGRALSATIFGSVARGDAELGSDIDLLLVAPPNSKARLAQEARDLASQFKRDHDLRISPIVFTRQELRNQLKAGSPLISNIRREGIDLLPSRLEELL
ncbi:MAG: nucleotidyltransferase domain-containing protein [Elusimicrobia bacterium]|nr:nucleotidyltransferase domain-containing protein [Elusimicrobiota bacterium]